MSSIPNVASNVTALPGNGPRVPNLVHGPQSPLVDTKRTCARIAGSEATVLLTGETGTGKEVFARFIHAQSTRGQRAFVAVNCGAIPDTLIESELFGYVKGAFTGAAASRKGRVAMAEGGTLFLDEIGELPLALQVKLLRLLQERTYEPVGSSESVSANFRLIAATNRDLAEEVRAGRFRSDLYYRLHVCPIRLPALRERRHDVAATFQHFWRERGETRPVEPGVIRRLESYDWPGNVRELENLVERLSVCAEGNVIRVADLPPGYDRPDDTTDVGLGDMGGALPVAEASVAETGESPMDGGGVAGADGAAAASVDLEGIAADVLTSPRPISLTSLAAVAAELRETAARELAEARAADGPSSGDDQIATPTPILQFPIDLPTMLRDLENQYINAALAKTGSNKKEAAKLLGMGRTTLVEKLRRRATDK